MNRFNAGPRRISALTLGCKVNAYDTEAMLELFAAQGYEVVEFGSAADVCLVNTCTVTSLSDKKSRQMLRRARRSNPDAIVVAAGCYAQVSPEAVLAIPEVDLAVGAADRLRIVGLVEDYDRRNGALNLVKNIMTEAEFEPLTVQKLDGRTRAYLKIQEGCDRYCTYCVIPYARGHIRSRPDQDVVDEVHRLAQGGYKEIVLSGIHVASYGLDLNNTDLPSLLSRVHEVVGICRIRLSSIDPCVITPAFLKRLAGLPKICPHFHLSLQSGCDKTLARMNRRYTTAQYAKAVNSLRELMPDIALTTDIIAGFPGETDADFEESYEFVKTIGFSRIHVFPYSPKAKTPAATFPGQIPPAIKTARANRLLALGNELSLKFMSSYVGRELEVLFETETEPGISEGYSLNYLTVRTAGKLFNEIRRVKITGVENNYLHGLEI